MSDKVFRDPLYNYISVDRDQDSWLLKLLDTREVQRLRRIHQLGVSNYTYPGADHNRLAHSLGVVHLMQMIVSHFQRNYPQVSNDGAARDALLAAALLHDVGHGPFSHLFEPCLGIKHEKWSIAVVLDSESEVHSALKKRDNFLPQRVANLIDENNHDQPTWQKLLLSSQLDADRLDYLRRDSLFTGAGYGHFDWYRLLTTVELFGDDPSDFDLVWPEKAALAIEEYIFARFYMYQNVYLHKTTRGFEQLLQAMWQRATTLMENGDDVHATPVLKDFWSHSDRTPGSLPLKKYLRIEEFAVLSQIDVWRNHPDKPLSDLAHRFLNRDGFAMIPAPSGENPLESGGDSEWLQALAEVVGKAGFENPACYCLFDDVDGKYRRPYKPEKEGQQQSASTAIRVRIKGESAPIEISSYLPRLAAVTNLPPPMRIYYVPKEARNDAKKLRETWTPSV
ncbi:MAG: HD domain-containing protein [Phycisphaeraceae bacterium]|nr:HD domain-containing protein [Phycisphaerales bacterium]MCB9859218.1 HD domain-containing protein [Phycisphaeraceae bacterium]